MNYRYQPTSESVLSAILARNPRASLHDISHSHPAFHGMSLDQLALRLGEVLDRRRAARQK